MRKATHASAMAGAVLIMAELGASSAQAAIAIDIKELAGSVVATSSGNFDTTGLARFGNGVSAGTGANGDVGVIRFGTGPQNIGWETVFVSGPTSFNKNSGFRPFTAATTAIGSAFSINGFLQSLDLPVGYVSGTTLAGTMTFAGATFASMGFQVGTYVYSTATDRVTITIGDVATPAVPEPSTWAMMALGLGMAGYGLRRHRRLATRVTYC